MKGGHLEEWIILKYHKVNALLITTTDHRATEKSKSGSLGEVSQVQKAPNSCA